MKKKSIKIILISILTVFIIAFLALNLPINLGGNTRYEPVLSGSMEPSISVGSLVLIKPVETGSLTVGDIICYHFSDERLVTHRIIEVNSEGFITKGDANEENDPKLVQKSDIVGSVVLTVPFVGYMGGLIRTPIGILVLLFIPGGLFILLEVREIIVNIRKEKKSALKI